MTFLHILLYIGTYTEFTPPKAVICQERVDARPLPPIHGHRDGVGGQPLWGSEKGLLRPEEKIRDHSRNPQKLEKIVLKSIKIDDK